MPVHTPTHTPTCTHRHAYIHHSRSPWVCHTFMSLTRPAHQAQICIRAAVPGFLCVSVSHTGLSMNLHGAHRLCSSSAGCHCSPWHGVHCSAGCHGLTCCSLGKVPPQVSALSPQEAVLGGSLWPREGKWPTALCITVRSGVPKQCCLCPRHYKNSFFHLSLVPFWLLGWRHIQVMAPIKALEATLPITASCSRHLEAGFHSLKAVLSLEISCPICQSLPSSPPSSDTCRSPQRTGQEFFHRTMFCTNILTASASPRSRLTGELSPVPAQQRTEMSAQV